jgi:hypothetical protein
LATSQGAPSAARFYVLQPIPVAVGLQFIIMEKYNVVRVLNSGSFGVCANLSCFLRTLLANFLLRHRHFGQ